MAPARGPAGPPRGLTPLLRLLALIAIIVAALVFFGLLVQSCASTSKHDAYKQLHGEGRHDRAELGGRRRGSRPPDDAWRQGRRPATKLAGIAEQERQNVAAAQSASTRRAGSAPRTEDLIEALQLRVNGVQGLADTFRATATSKASTDAALLAAPGRPAARERRHLGRPLPRARHERDEEAGHQRRRRARVALRHEPRPDHGAFDGARAAAAARRFDERRNADRDPRHEHRRDEGAAGRTGAVAVDTENTVTATTDLAFVVTIADSGDSQEVGIKVTLTIQKPQGAIVKTQTVDLINPGQTKSVTFTNLGQVPFAQKTTVNVDVAPVPGENDTSNNKASYPVIFSLEAYELASVG